ncbi:MAG: universal stress protein [Planctomycetes bacterium]|nr:universal stress protein [Planctomycetota bacterium]MBL7039124.1 universal stress protein [Pirellulaceae bacterium]
MPRSMRVLIATDGSEYSRAAVEMLMRLPLPRTAEAIVFSATPELAPINVEHEGLMKQLDEEAERIVSKEAEQLGKHGWSTRTLVREGHAAKEIVEAATEFQSDLVVVGLRGLMGMTQFLLGRVAQKAVKYTPCSVLVGRVRDESTGSAFVDADSTPARPLRVLLAYDGSNAAKAAVELFASLPLRDRADVTALSVLTVATTICGLDAVERRSDSWLLRKKKLRAELDMAAARLRDATPDVTAVLRHGGPDASRQILEAAREFDVDLIVVGHKGKSAIKRFLLGSVANRVVHHADRSVLVVR